MNPSSLRRKRLASVRMQTQLCTLTLTFSRRPRRRSHKLRAQLPGATDDRDLRPSVTPQIGDEPFFKLVHSEERHRVDGRLKRRIRRGASGWKLIDPSHRENLQWIGPPPGGGFGLGRVQRRAAGRELAVALRGRTPCAGRCEAMACRLQLNWQYAVPRPRAHHGPHVGAPA